MIKSFITLTLNLALVSSLSAQSPEEKGLAIAKKADAVSNGFVDQVVDVKMTLRNQHGQTTARDMKVKWLEVKGDGDKTLVIFNNPRDIKGTSFLSYTHKTGNDDQWLYLPALRRVKRISSNNKSGPFVGSEFAYEDISSQEVEKYTYKFLREETLDGKAALVIEQFPVDKNSGYTRQVVWYDAQEHIPLKIDFYDRKSALLKTLTYKNYKKYNGKDWRAEIFDMVNHQSGKSTTLAWTNFKFKNGFTARDFDQNSLKRAR